MALAWQTRLARALSPGRMARDCAGRSVRRVDARLQLRSLVLVAEDVVQLVGPVVELAEVLELEAQHQACGRA